MNNRDPSWARWCAAGLFSILAATVLWPLVRDGLTRHIVVFRVGAMPATTIGRFEGGGAILVSIGLVVLWIGFVAALVWLVIWLNDCD